MNRSGSGAQQTLGTAPRLRVAVVTETFPPEVNGVAVTMAEFVQALLERGHSVQLVRPQQHADDAPVPADSLEVLVRPGWTIPWYPTLRVGLPAVRFLARQWAACRPDIVYIATEGPLGWSALRAARRVGVPTISGFHTNFHHYSAHYGLGLLRRPILSYLRQFHNACGATLVATRELDEWLQSAGFTNTRAIVRGVDTKRFSPARRSESLRRAWGVGPSDLVVLFVGRLAPEKNLSLVIAAFRAMRSVTPCVRCVLVGDGPLRPELARQHPDVVLCGTQIGEALAAHYASADLFAFPSLTETFGNVVLEAMASGLVVLAYDYAAAHRRVRNGTNGFLAPLGNGDAFVERARQLAQAQRGLPEMRRRARLTAQRLDWRRVHGRLERILVRYALTAQQ